MPLALVILVALLASTAEATAPPPGAKTEEHFKNIQVLKGHPADQLVPAMQFMSAALGVECGYCHVERKPESDDKEEKRIAREMITMTLAINRDSFKGKREVTCETCHHGAEHPQSTPEVATGEPRESIRGNKPAELPTAQAILTRYAEATGSAEALNRIETRVQKGRLVGLGQAPLSVQIYAKAPDRRVTVVRTPRGENITGIDGNTGWTVEPGQPAREMSAAEIQAARLDADLRFPRRIEASFTAVRSRPGEPIDGRPTHRVIGRNEGQPPVEMWFDAEDGLLRRMIRYIESPLGRNPTRIDYANYKDADGVKIPFRWIVARPGGRFTVEIDQIEQNVPIDESRFAR